MKRWIWVAVWFAFVSLIIWLADTRQARWLFRWIDVTPGSDKLGHFILIGAMAFFLNVAFRCRRVGRLQLGSLIVGVVFLGEEISQLLLPWRHFDIGDLLADLLGILFFDWLAQRFIESRREV